MEKVKMGMAGGGEGAFIGQVHRQAAFLDGHIDLVCGAFSSIPEKSVKSGQSLYLPKERCYGSYQEMIAKEKQLPKDERMDFLCIVTPNHMHYPIAKLALENGFYVISDKPLTLNLTRSFRLTKACQKNRVAFCCNSCLFCLSFSERG